MNNLAYAMAQPPAGTGTGQPPRGGALGGFLPLILIFFVFYFLLIRPQQKKAKEHQKTLTALKRGDKVVTSGGIHGTVSKINGNLVDVKIADDVEVSFSKSSISAVIPPGQQTVEQAKTIEQK